MSFFSESKALRVRVQRETRPFPADLGAWRVDVFHYGPYERWAHVARWTTKREADAHAKRIRRALQAPTPNKKG